MSQMELMEQMRHIAKQLERPNLQSLIEECSELLYMKELQHATTYSARDTRVCMSVEEEEEEARQQQAYAELDERAAQMASQLRAVSSGPNGLPEV
jgi:hypothetical protein